MLLRGASHTLGASVVGVPPESTLSKYASNLLVLLLSVLFALRPMPTTYDDLNYLAYFSGLSAIETTTFWSWFVEEPVWRAGSQLLGSILGAEAAYRAVIFAAVLGFFWAARAIAGRALWIVLLLFVIDMSISTSLYSLAVRQGVATSVFALLWLAGLGPVLSLIAAASIHTGLAVFIPAAVIVQLLPKRSVAFTTTVALASALIVFAISLADIPGISLTSADLGRRTEHYSAAYELTVFYYLFFVAKYGAVLFVARPSSVQSPHFLLFLFVVVSSVCALMFIVLNGGFLRVLLTLNVLISYYLAATIRNRNAQAGLLIWVSLTIFTTINEARKAEAFVDTWAGSWALVLGLN